MEKGMITAGKSPYGDLIIVSNRLEKRCIYPVTALTVVHDWLNCSK